MNLQIAKIIFHSALSIMKKILDLVSFKVGKESEEYKFYKKEIMLYSYSGLKDLFQKLQSDKIIKRCNCKSDLKHGYKECECGGSGWVNE